MGPIVMSRRLFFCLYARLIHKKPYSCHNSDRKDEIGTCHHLLVTKVTYPVVAIRRDHL